MKEYIITYKDWDGLEKNTVIHASNTAEVHRIFKMKYPTGYITSCETGSEGCVKYILIAIGVICTMIVLFKSC